MRLTRSTPQSRNAGIPLGESLNPALSRGGGGGGSSAPRHTTSGRTLLPCFVSNVHGALFWSALVLLAVGATVFVVSLMTTTGTVPLLESGHSQGSSQAAHAQAAAAATVAAAKVATAAANVSRMSATNGGPVGGDEGKLWRSMKCDSDDPVAIAKAMLSHWVKIAAASHQELLASAPSAAAVGGTKHVEVTLREVDALSNKDYCLYKVEYLARRREFRVEDRNVTPTAFRIRTDVTVKFLTHLVQTRDGMLDPSVDFTFFFDATAATRDNPRLFRALGHPVLSQSRSLTERSTIPVPHTHQLLGMYQLYPEALLPLLPEHLRNASEGYHRINTFQTPAVPWAERVSKVVFRSSCFPTMSPYSPNPDDYIFPRAELCRAWSRHPKFDVGTYYSREFELCVHDALMDMCAGCSKCAKAVRMEPSNMTRYKYHINADGFGAAYDAMFWKLSIGGLLLWQLPDNDMSPSWVPWYWPALLPFKHFIPAPTHALGNAVDYCLDNDAACEVIAASARRTMVCSANTRVATEYYILLMQYLQCLAGQRDVLKCRLQLGV